jgi:hypothetical protein
LLLCSKLVKANESIGNQLAKKLREQREGLVSTYRGSRKQGKRLNSRIKNILRDHEREDAEI